MTGGPQPRAHWHDATDALMKLYRWYQTREGAMWMSESCRANLRSNGVPLSDSTQELIIRLYDAEMGRLANCDPVFVSESMCEIVDDARHSFQPEPLLESDLITPRGFLWFATPMHMADMHQVDIALRAASWSWEYEAKNPETAMRIMEEVNDPTRWAEHGDRIDPSEMTAYIESGDIWPAGVSVTLYAEREHYFRVGAQVMSQLQTEGLNLTRPVPVVPFHITPWHFGMTFDGNEVDEQGTVTGAEGWWTTLQTAFRLMQQRVAHVTTERASRDVRREAKKRGHSEPGIVVVRLRREEAPRPEGHVPAEGRKLKHKFWRTGHWRNQPYPSLGVHRQIWIDPTLVGDPDLPLLARPKRVYQWSR